MGRLSVWPITFKIIMSRIGKNPIELPENVTVEVKGSTVVVKGPKGELTRNIRPEIGVSVSEGKVVCSVSQETKNSSAYWGLSRALVANMIQGVSEGFEKKLELVGVGYRAKSSSGGVSLSVGYSHVVDYVAPEGVKVDVVDNTNITVSGIDKQLVGQAAAQIRAVRKPEPYKGKGIKYAGEVIRRKVGKSAKTI